MPYNPPQPSQNGFIFYESQNTNRSEIRPQRPNPNKTKEQK